MMRRWAAFLLAVLLVASGATTGAAPTTLPATRPAFLPDVTPPQARGRMSTVPVSAPRSIEDLRKIERRVEEVAKKVVPSTVGVIVRNGQGSGIIISPDGYVLTAGHVASLQNQECTVIMPDGKRLKAKTLGIDREMDAGLIKITEPGTYPTVEVGRSGTLRVGEWCVAIGHPGGWQRGRPAVLRLGRVLLNTPGAIMTDCTLVGGDSGGPLLDLDGKVIGIHSRIGQSTTTNLHVPVDTFTETWDRLAAGKAWGPWTPSPGGPMLGVVGVDDSKGCRVERANPNTPAEKIGLQADDIITKIDGRAVKGYQGMVDLIGEFMVGDEVKIEVLRGGERLNFTVKLGAQPEFRGRR